jgi:hypothetical protein
MKKIKFKTRFIVAFIFLSMAVLEIFRTRSWVGAGFWIGISAIFLLISNIDHKQREKQMTH